VCVCGCGGGGGVSHSCLHSKPESPGWQYSLWTVHIPQRNITGMAHNWKNTPSPLTGSIFRIIDIFCIKTNPFSFNSRLIITSWWLVSYLINKDSFTPILNFYNIMGYLSCVKNLQLCLMLSLPVIFLCLKTLDTAVVGKTCRKSRIGL